MPGFWTRATRLVACVTVDCERSMVRDDVVYLVGGHEIQPVCESCAFKRFERVPPADLPHLTPVIERTPAPTPAPQLPLSDGHEKPGAFQKFNHAFFSGETREAIKKVRAHQRQTNAIDPKLKQLGGDR